MQSVRVLLDGPESSRGRRSIWHSLQMNCMGVLRIVIEQLERELDPAGVQEGKAHRRKRRTYQNAGPNHSWHCNGYDKLKPYGFLIRKLQIRITTQQILVRKYLVNPIFRTGKLFFFRESMCVTCVTTSHGG